ncbi:Pycsar system effector family protein [Streptomyces buecherae]|uniref:Pycsar system effector family protein n=1 Tax=Streptomyces buecherae TaxID=2763006 RepID=UPI00340C1755
MTTPDPPTTRVATARAEVRAEIARADTKGALLLAFDAGLAAGTWAIARAGQPAATVIAGLAGAATLTSVLILLTIVRPRLQPPGDLPASGFPRWASLTTQEARAELDAVRPELDVTGLIGLSRLAVAKMRGLARAIDASAAAAVLLAVGGVVATV